MRQAIFICILILFVACKPAANNKPQLTADEYAVINAVLKAVIPADTTYKASVNFLNQPPLFPPPYPPGYTAKKIRAEKLAWAQHADSVKKMLDTARLYVFINDSMGHFPGHYLIGIGKGTKEGLSAAGFKNPLAVKQIALNVDTITQAQRFTRGLIRPLPHYTTIFYTGRAQLPEKRYTPGLYAISRVCFNKTKTLACVYTDSYCGEKCGRGTLFFLVKQAGVWIIIDSDMIWIA